MEDGMMFGRGHLGPIDQRNRSVLVIAVLLMTKTLYALAMFFSYDLLRSFHIAQFVFAVRLISSVILMVLQKPITSGKRITVSQWYAVIRHAIWNTLVTLLWIDGLTLCGPIRTVLLFEHSDIIILAALGVLFHTGVVAPSKLRGAVLFSFAIMSLLFFDNDNIVNHHPGEHEDSQQLHVVHHVLYHGFDWIGLPDHKGGLLLLFLTLMLKVGFKSSSRSLASDIGGSKRLNALSSCISTILLFPWAGFLFITRDVDINWTSSFLPLLFVAVIVFVIDFYVEGKCTLRLDTPRTIRVSAIGLFCAVIGISFLSNFSFFSSPLGWEADMIDNHGLSGGVIFTAILFFLATRLLSIHSSREGASKGNLIGYTAGGLPVYSFSSAPQSVVAALRGYLRQVLENTESRQIFYFLCLNLAFTGVELVYGVWTNSLGLISDGFHMLFDCTALVLGLCASIMTRWKATRMFSYGYGRMEILSGFVNGVFLVVIAGFLFCASLQRLFDPPQVKTERLLFVSVCGLLVNLFGIVAFRHAHSHGGVSQECGSHDHGRRHSHGHHHGHEHSHHGHHSHEVKPSHGHSHGSTNMQGVFLHVLADTLGSVGVILSSILIEQFGWFIADPICSLLIALLIFLSVIPLLRDSSLVLMMRTPKEMESPLRQVFNKIMSIDGVLSYRDQYFWQHSAKMVAGMVHVQVAPSVNEQKVIQQVTGLLKECGINNLCVQVEKEEFFQHMSALSAGYKSVLALTQGKASLMSPTSDPGFDFGMIKAI